MTELDRIKAMVDIELAEYIVRKRTEAVDAYCAGFFLPAFLRPCVYCAAK